MTIDDIKTKIRDIQKEYFFINFATIALGILLVVFPVKSIDFICRCLGGVMFVWGGFRIWDYVKHRKESVSAVLSLIQGCLLLGFGLFFILRPETLARFIIGACALILLLGAVIKLRIGIEYSTVSPVMRKIQTVGAVIMIIAGVIAFANPFGAASVLMIFLGISLIVDGLWDLITILFLRSFIKDIKSDIQKAVKKSDNTAKQEYVDAEYEDHTD